MKILLIVGLSLFLHFSIYFFLNKPDDLNTKVSKSTHKSTNSKITYVNIKAPQKEKTKIVKQKSKPKPIVKPIQKQKAKPKPKKISKKPSIEKVQVAKPIIKKEVKKIDRTTQTYLDLYGEEFENFSNETKVYLIKNIKDIASITKIFLEYPYMSIQAGQSGISIVEFMLYPNGTISDLKIIKTSKYFLLDDNTIETIEAAYSDYPRPTKPTVIRIYVKYILN